MLFSIVVPVYNAEKYLKNTIESVISQSFTDWQLVLVNDGSTDNSLEICKEYRALDNRIITVSQENAGPSAARNTGIATATGDYIMFLDSDDEYKPDAFINVAKVIGEKGVDLVMSSSEVINIDTGKTISDADYILDEDIDTFDDFLRQMVAKRVAPGPCRYAVRRRILTENNCYFPIDITIAEDCLWLNNMLGFIKSAAFNSSPFYKYNVHSNSITTTMSYSRLEDHMKVCDELFKLADSREGLIKNLHWNYCCILSNTLLQNYYEQNYENRKLIKTWVKKHNDDFSLALKMFSPIKAVSFFTGNFYAMLLFAVVVKMKSKIR